jgi:hypothetical protein
MKNNNKDITLKINKRELDIIKESLDNYKAVVRVKAATTTMQRKEMAINELYNIESIENKIKKETA